MKILITGGTGMLARAVIARGRAAGHEVVALSSAELDVTDAAAVERTIGKVAPALVVQCAAYTRVDDAETESELAHAINADGTAHVARACNDVGAKFVYPSTDYVFNGSGDAPYRPDHPTAPVNAYGRSKLAGEEAARSAQQHVIVRTSWLYGAGGKNFVSTMIRRARAGDPLRVVNDQRGCPTWTVDLADGLLQLADQAPSGVYHYSNAGVATWYDLACRTLELAGIRADLQPTSSDSYKTRAARPAYSVLDCSRSEPFTGRIRAWDVALAEALQVGV